MFVNETNSHLKLYWLLFPHLSAGKQTSSIIGALMCLSVSNSNSIQRFHFWTRPRIQTQFFCLKFHAPSPQSFCPFIKRLQAKHSYTAAVCDPSVHALKMYYYSRSVICWSVYFMHEDLFIEWWWYFWHKSAFFQSLQWNSKMIHKKIGLIDALWMNLTKPAKHVWFKLD